MASYNYIFNYEKAVLEWFNRAYPPIKSMSYGSDLSVLTADASKIVYPSLYYSRSKGDWMLPRGFTVVADNGRGSLDKAVLFSMSQTYEARLVVEKESEMFVAANAIRQYWYKDSYVGMRMGVSDEDLLRVGMRLLRFEVESVRNNLDDKGALRVLTMVWRSELVLPYVSEVPMLQGARVLLYADDYIVVGSGLPPTDKIEAEALAGDAVGAGAELVVGA